MSVAQYTLLIAVIISCAGIAAPPDKAEAAAAAGLCGVVLGITALVMAIV